MGGWRVGGDVECGVDGGAIRVEADGVVAGLVLEGEGEVDRAGLGVIGDAEGDVDDRLTSVDEVVDGGCRS